MTNITSTFLSSKRLSLVVYLRQPQLINRLFVPFSLSLFSPSKNSTSDLAQYGMIDCINFVRAALRDRASGSCEPVRTTGLLRPSRKKESAEAVHDIVS